MDKVKQYLEVARKHHFWILCGIVALAGMIAWMMSTGKLAAEFKVREGEIKSQLSALQGITSPHANETWNTGIEKTTSESRENVRSSWTLLYEDQVKNIYKWPESLNKDFLTAIAKVEAGKQAHLENRFRERYQNMVREFAKQLPKIVDAEVVEDTMSTGTPVSANPMELVDHKVVWDQQSQQEIFDTFTWIESPSTPMVLQAQEELWVYDALCKIIASVNKDAKGSHDAPITAIHQMVIAYMAQNGSSAGMGASNTGRIIRVKPATAAGGMELEGRAGMMGGMPGVDGAAGGAAACPDPKQRCKGAGGGGEFGGGRFGGPGGLGGGGDAAAAATPANPDEIWKGWRYVAEDNKPLMTAAELDASPLEYNLMPFRLKLTINPKEIDQLLVAFRNSTLPFEVKEVRVGDAAATSGGGGGGGGIMPGFRGGVGRGRMLEDMGAAPMAAATGVPQQKTIQIEVSGIVYLYKKPDPTKLGITPSTDGAAPTDGTAPPATPPQASLNWIDRRLIAFDFSRRERIRKNVLAPGL